MKALKHCPFCGNDNTKCRELFAYRYAVICRVCGAQGPWCHNPAPAKESWDCREQPRQRNDPAKRTTTPPVTVPTGESPKEAMRRVQKMHEQFGAFGDPPKDEGARGLRPTTDRQNDRKANP